MSVAAIAVGWGGNLNAFLDAAFGFELPDAIAKSPEDGGVFNLPAVFIVLAITLLLVRGTRESARVNLVMVGIKLLILIFFIVVAFTSFNSGNFHPFAPHGLDDGIVPAAGSSSSPTSASTRSRPAARSPTTRAATCRSRSSARW